jgi:hypothetical protein
MPWPPVQRRCWPGEELLALRKHMPHNTTSGPPGWRVQSRLLRKGKTLNLGVIAVAIHLETRVGHLC